jgi:hypothetical protein
MNCFRFWLSCLYSLVYLLQELIWVRNLLNLSVLDNGYSRNASCALTLKKQVFIQFDYPVLDIGSVLTVIVIEDIHVQHRSIDHQATRQNVDFWRYSNVQNIGMTI